MQIKKSLYIILLITIVILYIQFLYMDIFRIQSFVSSNLLKYTSIILCFLITLTIGKNGLSEKDTYLLRLGCFITILADLCLLFLHYYITGIILFALVQIIYYIRYKKCKASLAIIKFTIIFLYVIFVYSILRLLSIKIEVLFVIGFFYSICLILSTLESIRAFKNNFYPLPNKYMILIGMILFLLCDLNVAISNLIKGANMPLIYSISTILIWFFYLPSQILLSISGYKYRKWV